jgi:diamine N-acetyltransferase
MITISEALPNEFNIIQYVAYTTWPVCYGEILSKIQVNYMLDRFYTLEALNKNAAEGQNFLLIRENDAPLGFASYEHDYKNRNVTRIHKIYILPDTQGKGLGKMLIQKMQELAEKNGSESLSLNVNRYNPARSFYRKLGFEIIAEEDIPIGDGWLMEDYVMEKAL